ncbi:MAG TPA: glycosyl hydrolase [Caulobacterales bacterium]|nr:glycosyl hydrolase [Caulobacterales bacterium]
MLGAVRCAAVRVVIAFACAILLASPTFAQPTADKRAAILAYVNALQTEHRSLVGVQVNEYEVYIRCTSFNRVAQQIGARPAIMGLELMSAIEYPPYREYLTDRALSQTAAGGLVTMSWHHRNPTEVCPRGEFYECAKKPMTPETLQAMLTQGTREHELWLADVHAIADLLADWKRRGIVVLWRPYHEMNGDWFWWGQKDQYPDLWDALYDELAVRRGLDNLIWVWSGDRETPNSGRYFPRRHPPDIVGVDVYENDGDSPKYAAGRASVTQRAGGAAFALTEVGIVPSAGTLDAVNPAWVLLWGGEFLNDQWAWNNNCAYCNTPSQVADFFALARTLTLEEMPADIRRQVSAGVARGRPLRPDDPTCPARLR